MEWISAKMRSLMDGGCETVEDILHTSIVVFLFFVGKKIHLIFFVIDVEEIFMESRTQS